MMPVEGRVAETSGMVARETTVCLLIRFSPVRFSVVISPSGLDWAPELYGMLPWNWGNFSKRWPMGRARRPMSGGRADLDHRAQERHPDRCPAGRRLQGEAPEHPHNHNHSAPAPLQPDTH